MVSLRGGGAFAALDIADAIGGLLLLCFAGVGAATTGGWGRRRLRLLLLLLLHVGGLTLERGVDACEDLRQLALEVVVFGAIRLETLESLLLFASKLLLSCRESLKL